MNTPLTDSPTTRVAPTGHALSSSFRPDPQVPQRTARRRFTVAYKLRLLKEADACSPPGELGPCCGAKACPPPRSPTSANSAKPVSWARRIPCRPSSSVRTRLPSANAMPAALTTASVSCPSPAVRQRDARRLAALEAENQKLRVRLELPKK